VDATAIPQTVIDRLGELFRRNGNVRRQNADKLAAKGSTYKKGDEVRLTANTKTELREMRALLKHAGFEPGNAYAHGKQWRLPLYGRAEVVRFLKLIGEPLAPEPASE
jgi:hypothetical protein